MDRFECKLTHYAEPFYCFNYFAIVDDDDDCNDEINYVTCDSSATEITYHYHYQI